MSNGNTTPNIQQAIITAAGGASGGLCSVLYSFVTKQQLFGSVWLSILISIGLGVFAALVVVFVTKKVNLANSVTLFVWAMVIGFGWRPVVDATTALTHKVAQNYLASDARQLAAEAAKKSAELQPTEAGTEIKPKINQALAAAVETVKILPDVKDEKTRDQIRQSLVTTANQFQDVAVKSNDPSVAQDATNALKVLGETAAKTDSYGVANAVSKSLNDVAYQAKDKDIRGQAWTSKEKIDTLSIPTSAASRSR